MEIECSPPQISYEQIKAEAKKQLPEGTALQEVETSTIRIRRNARTAKLFYRHRQEEKPFVGHEMFGTDVHVFLRFDDDFYLLKNRMLTTLNCYKSLNSQTKDADLFNFARNISLHSKKSSITSKHTIETHELDLTVLVSNPLVRRNPSELEKFEAVERLPVNLRKERKQLKAILDKTQPIVQIRVAAASRREI